MVHRLAVAPPRDGTPRSTAFFCPEAARRGDEDALLASCGGTTNMFLSSPNSFAEISSAKWSLSERRSVIIMDVVLVMRHAPVVRQGAFVVLTARPKVAELVFQLYGRPLHPELFEVYHSRVVQREHYQAKIDITSAGHVVTWRHGGLTLTEVAASAQHPLPEKRRLLSYRLKGQRSDRVECRGGICYQVSFQLEPVDPEVFWTFQQELAEDGLR